MMIEIEDTVVSFELLKEKFVCDLSACKGACCVEGDSGAPLEHEELELLSAEFEKIKPFMRKKGIAAVKSQGTHVVDPDDGEYVTPLVNGKECAYVTFNSKGMALCAIEQANKAGKTDFKKPVSCHLYPVRVTPHRSFVAVNYHNWQICSDACKLGSSLNVKVYKFVKEALIRKFGEKWYKKLEKADELAQNINK